MQTYTCPTCGQTMDRDLLSFIKHTDQHILDEIKKNHPSWVNKDGFCERCMEHYKQASGKEGPALAPFVNIGPAQSRLRKIFGMTCLLMAIFWIYRNQSSGLRTFEAILPVFLFTFAGFLGLLQARKNICVILSFKNTQNLDDGEKKVEHLAQAKTLRRVSIGLIFISLVIAAIVTAFGYLISL